jgi:hypothetical protein
MDELKGGLPESVRSSYDAVHDRLLDIARRNPTAQAQITAIKAALETDEEFYLQMSELRWHRNGKALAVVKNESDLDGRVNLQDTMSIVGNKIMAGKLKVLTHYVGDRTQFADAFESKCGEDRLFRIECERLLKMNDDGTMANYVRLDAICDRIGMPEGTTKTQFINMLTGAHVSSSKDRK